jgi:hypothetical protein
MGSNTDGVLALAEKSRYFLIVAIDFEKDQTLFFSQPYSTQDSGQWL